MVQLSTSWQLLNSTTLTYYSSFSGTFQLWAKYSTQEVANNRTKVHYSWEMVLNSGWITSYDAQDYVTNSGWNDATYREYTSSKTLRTWEGWISHNANGTGSGSCTGRTRMGGMGLDTGDVSATFTLPTIPRASQPTASPNPLTIGSSGATLTVNTNRKSSSFTHTIKVQCGSWSWTSSARAVGASVNVTVPYSVIAQFSATSKTATATVTCTTFNGTTQIASAKTCSVTFQINTSVDHPNIGTVTLSEGNARVASIVATADTFVQGISTLEVSAPITVSGDYTELAKVTVANGADNQTYTLSGTSGTLNYSCANNRTTWLTITAYDKRGTTAVSKPAWTLLPYAPITMTASVGRVSATGSTATGQISGVAYGGDYGQSTNSLTVTYRWKLHDSTTWTDGSQTYTLPISGSGQTNYSHAITFSEAFDYQYQYDIEFTVNDLFSTAVYTCQLMQGLPIISWDETEVDVFGNLHIHDRDNPTQWQDVMQGFDAVFAYNGQKNLVPNTTATETKSGITYTLQNDGSVKCTGTYSANSWHVIANLYLDAGDYVLTGCPSGGGTSDYTLCLADSNDSLIARDDGEGTTFTLTTGTNCVLRIYAYSNNISGKTFYPMIRDARIAADTFVRYDTTPCYDVNITKAVSNISDVEFAFVTVYGRLCILEVKFTVSSTISSTTAVLFTGLPPAKRTYRAMLGEVTGATKQIRILVNTVGSLQNAWTSGGIPAGQYEGQLVYIMQ